MSQVTSPSQTEPAPAETPQEAQNQPAATSTTLPVATTRPWYPPGPESLDSAEGIPEALPAADIRQMERTLAVFAKQLEALSDQKVAEGLIPAEALKAKPVDIVIKADIRIYHQGAEIIRVDSLNVMPSLTAPDMIRESLRNVEHTFYHNTLRPVLSQFTAFISSIIKNENGTGVSGNAVQPEKLTPTNSKFLGLP